MRDNNILYLSIVIPAYNEESRLPVTLDSVFDYLATQDYSYEVIIVDDGSTDHTVQIVKDNPAYSEKIRLISLAHNSGKGAAIKCGIEAAQGDFIIYYDADGATPISEIEKLFQEIHEGYDIAIGSRANKASRINDLWYRKMLGFLFNFAIKVILIPDFDDTQCGFKLFRSECAKKVFKNIILSGFSFDAEALFVARKLGYKVAEVPVVWNSIPGSKVNVYIHSVTMTLQVMRIRLLYILGLYRIKKD